MMAASVKDGDELVELLLQKEADPNMKSMPLELCTQVIAETSALDFNGQVSPSVLISGFSHKFHLHDQTALHFCASKNNIDTARKLIAHKASTRIRDKRQQLPIHRAAAAGSVPMLQLLIDNKSPLNATDIAGLTPLHHGRLHLESN